MRGRISKFLVTGGAGFIGSAFVRKLAGKRRPAVLDKLTYAGDLERLKEIKGGFSFYKADIKDRQAVKKILKKEKPDIVVHFAAESHVDRSLKSAAEFIETNIKGTQVLLDACRDCEISKFVFISTDEIYGEIKNGKFDERSALRPGNPYAASKAAADMLVQSYIRTYGFPAMIIRPSNNYGPWQYPEKLIPLAVLKLCQGNKIPLYGKGENIREWLYVDDCVKGINCLIDKGRWGQIYNLGSSQESRNIDTAVMLLKLAGAARNRIEFIKDRPGHDIRYCLNSDKAKKETGWQAGISFSEGLSRTVKWCLSNKRWLTEKWRNVAPLYQDK